MCLATRCATVDELVAQFHKCCDETSIFVATKTMRPVGSESPFAVLLADKTPAIRGWCVVYDAWTDGKNPFGRPGLRLGIEKLTAQSREVFERLLAARAAALVDGVRRPTDPPPTKQKPKTVQIPIIAATTEPAPPEAPSAPADPMPALPPPPPAVSPMAFAKSPPPIPPKPATSRVPVVAMPKVLPPAAPASRAIPIIAKPRAQSPAMIIAPVPTDVTPAIAASAAADDGTWAATVARELRTTDPIALMPPPAAPAPRLAESSSGFARGSSIPIDIGDVELGLAGAPRPDATPLPPPPVAAAAETRTPGSNIVVPANPFTNISDDALGGFVENTLLEKAEQQAAPPPPARLAQASQPMPLGNLTDGVPNLPRLAIGDRQLVFGMLAAGVALLLLLAVVLAI